MRRRTLLRATCAALLLAPVPGRAQAPKRLALFKQGADPSKALQDFRERQAAGLADRGWIEGKTLVLELYLVDKSLEEHLEGARRLVATRPDVIFTNTWFLAKALRAATTTIPIVAVIGDPVGAGLATSLARPGGNITGISLAIDVAIGRQRELLHELLPRLATIYSFLGMKGTETRPVVRPVGSLAELEAMLARDKPRAGTAALHVPIWIPGGGFREMTDGYREAAQLALRHRLASMGMNREFVDAGGLACYSLQYRDEDHPRVAAVFDRMLRGGDPATTPFEMPTHAVFGLNRRTAAAIGIDVPAAWMLRANHVV